jgi:hypothetical protein
LKCLILYYITENIVYSGNRLKKYSFGGRGHGESFDEVTVLDKSKDGIVVAVFAGFASGKFRG